MTSFQRKAHLLLWLVLAPLVLAGLLLALVWRPVEPVQNGPLPGVSAQDPSRPPDPGDAP